MKRIDLFRTPQGWMARWYEQAIHDLFGTDVLPTAFTDKADAHTVRREIQRLNPGDEVNVL